MALSSIEAAVRSYDNWHHPWEFERAVAAKLDESDRREFDLICQDANKDEHWIDCRTLQDGAARATRALEEKYPELASDVIKDIVNAAAYSWK